MFNDHTEILKLLIDAGADVDAKVLKIANEKKNSEIINILSNRKGVFHL
jgi:ankyrin repeat protein